MFLKHGKQLNVSLVPMASHWGSKTAVAQKEVEKFFFLFGCFGLVLGFSFVLFWLFFVVVLFSVLWGGLFCWSLPLFLELLFDCFYFVLFLLLRLGLSTYPWLSCGPG